MNYRAQYEMWLRDDAINEATKAELRALTDEKEIEDRFYTELQFGTAGIRGVIGAGTNRINKYIVAKATQGYAHYLKTSNFERGVAIAFDSRLMSDEFALEAALVLCANSIPVYLFDSIRSVPQLSFALLYYGCAGGIVITASHNPKQYNGYKVYGDNGAQIGPVEAGAVTHAISQVTSFASIARITKEEALSSGLLRIIGPEVDEAYYSYVKGLIINPNVFAAAADFKLVYTPLHGAGNVPVRRVLNDLGIGNLHVVPEQELPDPCFSTVSAPNPELREVFDLSIALAGKVGADLLFATDPDADRLGVAACAGNGEFGVLSGNQIGCLILHYILSARKELNDLPSDGFVVKSIVSTSLCDAICADFGVELDEVLTGFRYVGEKIAQSVADGSRTFLFGFEESYGYLTGTRVRDKDAICAVALLSETAAWYATRGMTLLDGLEEIFQKYGYYHEIVNSHTLYGKEGLEKIASAMKRLRSDPPSHLAEIDVYAIRDYQSGKRTVTKTGEVSPITLPQSDVLYFEMEDKSWLCIRPSGTEPKLKLYANGCADSHSAAERKLQGMLSALEELLSPYLSISD